MHTNNTQQRRNQHSPRLPICGLQCAAAIGLLSHLRSYKRWVSSVDLDGRLHHSFQI